jgi:hypothetical protein
MRGHEPLIALRRAGWKPAMAWVSVDGYSETFTNLSRLGFPPLDAIELAATDSPARVDLRCVIGMTVEVSGSDERRVAATARACRDFGATQVVAMTPDRITFTNEELDKWPR